jgi:hypothetical protein
MFSLEEDGYHAPSVEPTTGRFLKPKHHSTLYKELEWYNSEDPNAVEFRKTHDLDTTGKYYQYVPKEMAEGGPVKKFLQPTQTFQNIGYNPRENGISTEYSTTVGKDGEYYLVPGFKQGRLVEDPEGLFNFTGEHLGGPFKSIQSAEDFANFRHKYVEQNKNIPLIFKTRDYAMGGSLPGAVGFMYARTNDPAPSNGPYAKKTKASAKNGMEMKYYQEGLDWKPKSMRKGGETPKMGKAAIARNQRIAKADAAANQPLSPETIATRANAFPDRALFSKAFEDSFPSVSNWIDNNPVASYIDQNLNPSVFVGKIMSNYGHIPLNIKQGNYEQAVMNAFSPLIYMSSAPSTKSLTDPNSPNQKMPTPYFLKKHKQGGQLTKLDQLTNFTNYNTKQPGGWLDKYQD